MDNTWYEKQHNATLKPEAHAMTRVLQQRCYRADIPQKWQSFSLDGGHNTDKEEIQKCEAPQTWHLVEHNR